MPRYLARHRVHDIKQAMLIASVAPYLLAGDDNPDGVPGQVFDDIKSGLRRDRPDFLQQFFPVFYGQGTKGGGVSDAVLRWAWGMAMQASAKATLDCVDAFGRTDLRADMAAFDLPTLVIHGTNDRTVPIEVSGRAAAKAAAQAELIEYEGAPHGLTATHAEQLFDDMLAFLKG